MTDEQRRDFLWKTIGRFDFYINSTNAKAAFVLAFNTFILGLVAANTESLLSPFSDPRLKCIVGVVLLLLPLTLLASLGFALAVINPFLRSPSSPGGYHSRIFFGAVAGFENAAAYRTSMAALTDAEAEEDLAKQAFTLAQGATSKFCHLKWAIGLLLFGVLPLGLIYLLFRIVFSIF